MAPQPITAVIGTVVVLFSAACTATHKGPGTRNDDRSHQPSSPLASPDFTVGDPCPPSKDAALGPGTGCASYTSADLDGDGRAERIAVFAFLRPDRMPASWSVASESRSLHVVHPLNVEVATTYPRVLGAADANGDGRAEIFVSVANHLFHSGGFLEVGVLVLHDERLVRVRANGRPFRFPLGGLTHFGSGALCSKREPARLILFDIRNVNTGVFPTLSRFVYEWRGPALHLAHEGERRLPIKGYGSRKVLRYYALRCGSLRVNG
ncbi:hypothetical protein BH18ACT15_BH18ACT15_10980 [soil metagenome]